MLCGYRTLSVGLFIDLESYEQYGLKEYVMDNSYQIEKKV